MPLDIKNRAAPLFLKICGRLPLGWSRRLGWLAGQLAVLAGYLGVGRGLRISRINLALCYPAMAPARRARLARESLVNSAITGFEVATLWHQPWELSRTQILAMRNEQLLRDALAQARGVIVLVPHIGNWEIVGQYLATMAPTTSLYAPPKIAALDPIIRAGREATGARLVPTDLRGVRQLLKSLKAGEIAGILPDQEPDSGSGEMAPFFGRPALTMTLVHSLLQRTGCRCLFGFGRRVRGGFELVFLPAEQAIYSAETKVSLAALNRGVEACIAEAPAQYQWEYKRFRKQPQGRNWLYRGR